MLMLQKAKRGVVYESPNTNKKPNELVEINESIAYFKDNVTSFDLRKL